jgi:hypothetical protein
LQALQYLARDIQLMARKAATPLGVMHDVGHEEAWIIALLEQARYLKIRDDSGCWGIWPVFADVRSLFDCCSGAAA